MQKSVKLTIYIIMMIAHVFACLLAIQSFISMHIARTFEKQLHRYQ